MKRALLIGAGTIAGTAAVLGYHPGTWFTEPVQALPASGGFSADAPAAVTDAVASSGSAGVQQAAAPTTKTYRGKAVDPGYGPVQVQIVVTDGQLASVTGVQQSSDGKSRQISSYALPQLEQQAMAAQSSKLDGVSGASYTTAGFEKSLQSALTKAGLA